MADLSDNLSAIDDFVNDLSDQAASWYSIVADKPVVVPSANIAAQQQVVAQQPSIGVVSTPIGSYLSSSTLVLVAAIAVVAIVVLKG